MARKLIVEIVGDASSLERSFRRAGTRTKSLEANVKGLHRSVSGLAAGFGALFGVIGAEHVIKGAIEDYEDLAKTQRQLSAQLKTSGESFAALEPKIVALNRRFEKLGFSNRDTEEAFTRLDRASSNSAEAFREIGVTADLARIRHIKFGQAALLIGKIIQGNTTALNRFGIIIPKTTSKVDALAIVHRKLAGQAAAAVTPIERLRAVSTDLQARVGGLLAEALNPYLDRLSVWLTRSQNQERVMRAVEKVMEQLKAVTAALVPLMIRFANTTNRIADAVGGWSTALKILIAIKLATALRSWIIALGAFNARLLVLVGAVILLHKGLKDLPGSGHTAAGNLLRDRFGSTGKQGLLGQALGAGHGALLVPGVGLPLLASEKVWEQFMGQSRKAADAAKITAQTWSQAIAELNRFAILPLATIVRGFDTAEARGQAALGSTARPRQRNAGPFKNLVVPYALRLEEAKANASGQQSALVQAARDMRTFLFRIIPRLKGKGLLDAYAALGQANATIAQATKDAADKSAAAAQKIADANKKAADAMKAAAVRTAAIAKEQADKIKAAMADVRQRFQNQLANVKSVIGDLFAGPILQPSEAALKARLGVKNQAVDPNAILADIKAQTAQASRFYTDLAKLRKLGGGALATTIQGQGLAALPQLEAILGAPAATRAGIIKAYGAHQRFAVKVASMAVQAQKVTFSAREPVIVEVSLDGKVIARSVSKHQSKAATAQTTQRRGKHAGFGPQVA